MIKTMLGLVLTACVIPAHAVNDWVNIKVFCTSTEEAASTILNDYNEKPLLTGYSVVMGNNSKPLAGKMLITASASRKYSILFFPDADSETACLIHAGEDLNIINSSQLRGYQ